MRRLREMEIIQIDITNACVHACSNCTRMCGNHNKNFFMSFDEFKNAIDSLEGFEGYVGIMGGEPLIHPEFERFVEYAASEIKERMPRDAQFHAPKEDYISFTADHVMVARPIVKSKGMVLLSSIPKQYYQHYELITDTFDNYSLNDHSNPSYHQPPMISYKDLGIPYDEFINLRDNCWLQEKWSASITPKGAFFCEIAGALDMLFDGPGGWAVKPGWWKREIEEYEDQTHWCELCGICLSTRTRDANDEIDDVSETLYEMLKKIDSPRLKKGKIEIYKNQEQDQHSKMTSSGKYILENQQRLEEAKKVLTPKSFTALKMDELEETNRDEIKKRDWIALYREEGTFQLEMLTRQLKEMILNPGVLYIFNDINQTVKFFNPNAKAVREYFKNYDPDKKINWKHIFEKWPKDKQFMINRQTFLADSVDDDFYEEKTLEAYKNDSAFIDELRKRLSKVNKSDPMLVTMTSRAPNTRAMVRLLAEEGYNVHLIASINHRDKLEELLPYKKIHFFYGGRLEIDELEDDFAAEIKALNFAGCIMPSLVSADHLLEKDGMNEAIKTIESMDINILGIINGKRKFCEYE